MVQKRRILIVEDDADIRFILEDLLTAQGYEIILARHGGEALNYLRKGPPPHLILLDLMMPEVDGFEFRRRQLEEFPETRDVPTLLMTADRRASERVGPLRAQGCLAKPMDVDILLQHILEIL
jgi:two-component system chemotaxis response regulator CheY